MILNKNILKKLRHQLPKNYTTTLSKRCKCSQCHVINIIFGRRKDNFKVVEYAIELVKETRQKSELLTTEIEKLCQPKIIE